MTDMLQAFFHAWERRLASATSDRTVRPFDWGLDWIPQKGHRADAAFAPEALRRASPELADFAGERRRASHADIVGDWVAEVMADTDSFFTPQPTTDYMLRGDLLTFPSAFITPHPENNTVNCRYFPARVRDGLKTVP